MKFRFKFLYLFLLAASLPILSYAQTINGLAVPNADFNSTVPSADGGYVACTYKTSGLNVISECPSGSATSNALVESFTVGTGGVTVNTLVQTTSDNPSKVVASTSGVYGVALATVAAAGTASIQRAGIATCVADNNFTSGDLAIIGTTTVPDCKDSGVTAVSSTPITTRVVGVILTTGLAGATMQLELLPSHFGTQGNFGAGAISTTTSISAATELTASNCAANGTAANPSVVTCGAASAGMFSCSASATTGTCTVNTSSVTANSEVLIIQDDSDGGASQLNVTCNTGNVLKTTAPLLAAKVAATSFTINLGTVTSNPACFEYRIVN